MRNDGQDVTFQPRCCSFLLHTHTAIHPPSAYSCLSATTNTHRHNQPLCVGRWDWHGNEISSSFSPSARGHNTLLSLAPEQSIGGEEIHGNKSRRYKIHKQCPMRGVLPKPLFLPEKPCRERHFSSWDTGTTTAPAALCPFKSPLSTYQSWGYQFQPERVSLAFVLSITTTTQPHYARIEQCPEKSFVADNRKRRE